MGCDIHLYTETLNTVNDVNAWRNVDLWEYDYYDNKYTIHHAFSDRSYDCFAALADVRNRGHIEPLSEPRGMPVDVCERTKEQFWEGDGHSASWATLQEIYEYEAKHGKTKQSGMVSPAQAAIIDTGGLPSEWCGATSDRSYVEREWTRDYSPVDRLIKAIEIRARDVFWLYDEKPIKKELAEKFRIVFFFDN